MSPRAGAFCLSCGVWHRELPADHKRLSEAPLGGRPEGGVNWAEGRLSKADLAVVREWCKRFKPKGQQ